MCAFPCLPFSCVLRLFYEIQHFVVFFSSNFVSCIFFFTRSFILCLVHQILVLQSFYDFAPCVFLTISCDFSLFHQILVLGLFHQNFCLASFFLPDLVLCIFFTRFSILRFASFSPDFVLYVFFTKFSTKISLSGRYNRYAIKL